MDIRKSVFNGIVSVLGIILLIVLAVLYCFTEFSVPTPVYAAAWFGCIAVVLGVTRS